MKQVEHLLNATIGLDSASIGSTLIERAVRLRMRSHGLKMVEDYRRLLQSSQPEWNELVEAVLVTETWFFRDRECFAALVRLVLEDWLPAHPGGQARLLSVPCASGEEPYTLVMALLEAGVPPERFHLDAADISARSLALAKRGIFGKNSFRGQNLGFRNRYFQAAKEGFSLNEAIRSGVHFHLDNILSGDFLAGCGPYDFIFCRNLLIYFDSVSRLKAIKAIRGLLAPGGVLFVGAAEQRLVLEHGFVSANIPMAFACREANPLQGESEARHRYPVRAPWNSSSSPAPRPPRSARAVKSDLENARRLANAGRFEEATELCEAHLRAQAGSAEAYYLLGLLRDARNDATAVDFYRRALYLAPDHYECLLQMSLLSHKNGDLAGARAFSQRAQRHKPNQIREP